MVAKATYFSIIHKLEDFPFDKDLLSCQNKRQFPDLAIKLNTNNRLFTGGELIELKDSKTYTVASFNSTIPSGKKRIDQIIKSENSLIKKQMESAGDNINELLERDVFYLIRGRNKESLKIVLIHGSFFETIESQNLFDNFIEQVLNETINKDVIDLDNNVKKLLYDTFYNRDDKCIQLVNNASVKLQFQIVSEVIAEGNILDANKYPQIKDDTINLIIPLEAKEDEELNYKKFRAVLNYQSSEQFNVFKMKHILNGYFTVFQLNLPSLN